MSDNKNNTFLLSILGVEYFFKLTLVLHFFFCEMGIIRVSFLRML